MTEPRDKAIALVRVGGPDAAPSLVRRNAPPAAQTPQRVARPGTGELLARVLHYQPDIRIINHGPLAAPSERYEVIAFIARDMVVARGATPAAAVFAFAEVIAARIGGRLPP